MGVNVTVTRLDYKLLLTGRVALKFMFKKEIVRPCLVNVYGQICRMIIRKIKVQRRWRGIRVELQIK